MGVYLPYLEEETQHQTSGALWGTGIQKPLAPAQPAPAGGATSQPTGLGNPIHQPTHKKQKDPTMTTHTTDNITSEITRRLLTKLNKNLSIDQLYEETIAELKEEHSTNPDEQLHYIPINNPTADALCGLTAPQGGWFHQGARDKAPILRLIGSICPICTHKYNLLPSGQAAA